MGGYSREKWRLGPPVNDPASPIREATGRSTRGFLNDLDGDGYEGEHPGDNRALFNLGNGGRRKLSRRPN